MQVISQKADKNCTSYRGEVEEGDEEGGIERREVEEVGGVG